MSERNATGGKSLENWIWDAACSIRRAQEAAKYKDFILPLIFTKRLCDVFYDELNRIAEKVGYRASISTTGYLTLNTELLDLPKELGEFVIVHELVHLLVPNHGKLFKCLMTAYLPDWEEKERKLQMSQNS